MSIRSEIDRLLRAKADIIEQIMAKGVTVPSGVLIDDLADLIRAIPSGGDAPSGGGGAGKIFTGYEITSQSGKWSFDLAQYGNNNLWISCWLTHNSVLYEEEVFDGDDVYYNPVYDDPYAAGYYILRNGDGFVTDLQEEMCDMAPWYVSINLDTSQLADTGKAYFHAHCTLGDCGDAHIDVEIIFS